MDWRLTMKLYQVKQDNPNNSNSQNRQDNGMEEQITLPDLHTALRINLSSRQTIAFVGAGGKTTSIYTLAKELSSLGKRVVITTTTHMFLPDDNGVLEENKELLLKQLNISGIAVAGIPCTEKKALGKMSGISTPFYQWIRRVADYILVEADGSKRLPIKVPANHEPVLPDETDMVVVVGGLSCLNQPLNECCHRWELAMELLECSPNKIIEPKDMANLLTKGYFYNKENIQLPSYLPRKIYLNQCDNKNMDKQALKVIANLKIEGISIDNIIAGNLL